MRGGDRKLNLFDNMRLEVKMNMMFHENFGLCVQFLKNFETYSCSGKHIKFTCGFGKVGSKLILNICLVTHVVTTKVF